LRSQVVEPVRYQFNQENSADGQLEVSEILTAGVAILGHLMRSHGFEYTSTSAGVGSGGSYAAGEFRRANRSLELHFRYSLGLVTYHLGSAALSHEDYMWSVLGKKWASHYPGFSGDPLDGFRHLLLDLEQRASDFLGGSDSDFMKHVERAEFLKNGRSRLP
jgi:hypothetical protein